MFYSFTQELANGSIREFVNEELESVREQIPHLVPVAASLLPFRDTFSRIGVWTHPNDESKGLIVQMHSTSAFAWQALVSEACVTLQRVPREEDYFGPPVEVVHTTLVAFWEFLRQLPRHPCSFEISEHYAVLENGPDEEDIDEETEE